MYKKMTAMVLAGMIGLVSQAQESSQQCPKGEQRGKCSIKSRCGSMEHGQRRMDELRGKYGMSGKHGECGKGGLRGSKHSMGRGGMHGQMFSQLGLLNEQKEQIKVLTDKMREVCSADKDSYKEFFEAQKELIKAEKFDEEAYRSNIRKIAQIKEDMAVKQSLIKREIHAILTPTQKQKLDELTTEIKEKWEAMKKEKESQ